MFLELKTIWKRLPGQSEQAQNTVPLKAATGSGTSNMGRERHWEDRRRRIGILFSRSQDTRIWNFLVLIGPGDNEMGFSIFDEDEGSEFPNTHLRNGRRAWCTHRILHLRNIINYIDVRLKKHGPSSVESLIRAIIFGWGEFLKEMRSEIIKATPASSMADLG
jgi:hypothetical protein